MSITLAVVRAHMGLALILPAVLRILKALYALSIYLSLPMRCCTVGRRCHQSRLTDKIAVNLRRGKLSFAHAS